jgi:hypothetical protein
MLQFNQAKTPQQNGVTKNMNHTFLDKAKSIMLEMVPLTTFVQKQLVLYLTCITNVQQWSTTRLF